MALAFNSTQGKAKSREFDFFQVENENKVRLFGGVRARYDYWLTNDKGAKLPFECIQFDDQKEMFDRNATDPVGDWIKDKNLMDNYGNPIRCRWAYSMLCYNYSTGKVEVMGFKKSVYDKLMRLTQKLGQKTGKPVDPTSLDEFGFDLSFSREKTGPKPFDVEYEVDPYVDLGAVDDNVRSIIEEVMNRTSIDEISPRPTADEVQKNLERFFATDEEADNSGDATGDDIPNEVASAMQSGSVNFDEDIPF